ncbi:MAG: DEAD/DEAH box helicase [Firmicutes bacterium]|nr:DEAD/DEAH box helicase [Bacillota bacterium]
MIRELGKVIKNKELDEIVEFVSGAKDNCVVTMDDLSVAPLIASANIKPFVYIVSNSESVPEIASFFKGLGLRVSACEIEPDLPIYTEGKQAANELYNALHLFMDKQSDVLIIPATSLLFNIPSVKSSAIEIKVNVKMDIKSTCGSLENFGYTRVTRVSQAGDFSNKGDVVDIWQDGEESPIRVMFFGDTVEAIKKIESSDFSTIERVDSIIINPISSFANVSSDMIRKKLETVNIKHENTRAIVDSLNTRLDKGQTLGDVRWLNALLFKQASILEELRAISPLIIFERPREIYENLKSLEIQNSKRIESLVDGGLLLDMHGTVLGNAFEIESELEKFTCIGFQSVGALPPLFKVKKTFSLKTLPTANYFSALGVLVPDIIRNVNTHKKTVVVFASNSKSLENYLGSKGVEFNVSTLDKIKDGVVNIIYRTLGLSFEIAGSNIVVYSITSPSKQIKPSTPEKMSGEFVMPSVGEIVVHDFHGIGRYLGTKSLVLGSEEKDYMVLQYDGGAFVYVPLEQMGVLSNYHGEPTRLNRIGGKDFADAKQRVRRRLKELSFKLGELYVKRAKARPSIYDCEEIIMEEFFNSFPFDYTRDQLKALEDIKNDMTGSSVMDRLVCGDVGYGKTEVALHAAFRAIMSGYQVAMLCPTTILSVQHGNTAKSRLGKFGVRVEVLNRFKTDSEVREILDGLKSGSVDMVIGTHRLLSGDILFKNLSLLILDEEQRFGVSHKEKIKTIKSNIDVLTLSATPIPRTLNMALVGIRDISNITTAPVNRTPIITYVSEYSEELALDAILREHSRGGQVLVLFNNVSGVEAYVARLRKILPGGMRVDIAHGQMSATRLEDTIYRMYNREIDVLVASTIIENGIDIATANTLVVVDSDRLGVAQMHQLRGRVGRSDVQAYAYFTYQRNKEISEISRKRLDAIQKFAGTGAGYNIAMRDLQIRGAGDLLGAEQSGHIDQVGFEVYMKILKEIADEIK